MPATSEGHQPPQSSAIEPISVVVPTRGRGSLVLRTVESILGNDISPAEVIVVDQSDDNQTETAMAAFQGDNRVRYIRSSTRGISAARNIGIQHTSGEIIANTDDDCEVARDWLSGIAKSFSECPEASIAFGNVEAASHSTQGIIPAFRADRRILIRGVSQKHKVEGIGACFAFRTPLWSEVGGFDELLGTGGRFASAEETDFVIRALAKGHAVLQTSNFRVVHHGFRPWCDVGELVEGYLYGIGAMSAKQVRLNGIAYVHVMARLAARWAWGKPVVDLGPTPPRSVRLRAFLRGFAEAWRLPTDRDGRFLPPNGRE